jgi:chromosome segregation ATPase
MLNRTTPITERSSGAEVSDFNPARSLQPVPAVQKDKLPDIDGLTLPALLARLSHVDAALGQFSSVAERVLQLEGQLAEMALQLERSRTEVRCLQQDLEVKESYLAKLREADRDRAGVEQRCKEQVADIKQHLDTALAHIVTQKASIASQDDNIRVLQNCLAKAESQASVSMHALAASRDEIAGYQATLRQPRYRVANRVNRLLRWTGPIHYITKVLVSGVNRGR